MTQKPAAVALGLFDGVHLGHRRVLEMVRMQKERGLLPCVSTFAVETIQVKHGGILEYLYPTEQRYRILTDDCGMEQVYQPDFAQVRDMDGTAFVERILLERFAAKHVCCGRDFRFGKGAAWGVQDLLHFGTVYGFTVEIVEDVLHDGQPISSRRIRQSLQQGDVITASTLLGHPYTIEQEVVHGAKLGRTIGFPTINQVFAAGQLVPKFGVYASETTVDGVIYPSITNIGRKPTVDYDGMPLAETYLIGAEGNFYGKKLPVALRRFIRCEQKFASVEALTAQMQRDLAACGNG